MENLRHELIRAVFLRKYQAKSSFQPNDIIEIIILSKFEYFIKPWLLTVKPCLNIQKFREKSSYQVSILHRNVKVKENLKEKKWNSLSLTNEKSFKTLLNSCMFPINSCRNK